MKVERDSYSLRAVNAGTLTVILLFTLWDNLHISVCFLIINVAFVVL